MQTQLAASGQAAAIAGSSTVQHILTLNAGSSSIKFALFERGTPIVEVEQDARDDPPGLVDLR